MRFRVFVGAVALSAFGSTASAQVADHLQCFKIKDSAAKTSYTANLVPNDLGFLVSTGCTIQVPAKLICIDVEKQNVVPTPPGSPDGAPAQRYLCYKTKCAKQQPVVNMQDQFGSRSVAVKTSSLVCAPEPASVSTTTTTTTLPCPNFDADMDGYFAPPCGNDCDDTNPLVNPAAVEVCDGSDNDCDGNVDEGLGSSTCGVGQCQNTVANCVGGVPNFCTPNAPSTEICNSGIDEDCDGLVDEAPCGCTTAGDCPSPPNASPQCVANTCSFVCLPDYADCNMNNVDGCEVYTAADPNNCGGCNVVCSIPTPNCVNSTCQP